MLYASMFVFFSVRFAKNVCVWPAWCRDWWRHSNREQGEGRWGERNLFFGVDSSFSFFLCVVPNVLGADQGAVLTCWTTWLCLDGACPSMPLPEECSYSRFLLESLGVLFLTQQHWAFLIGWFRFLPAVLSLLWELAAKEQAINGGGLLSWTIFGWRLQQSLMSGKQPYHGSCPLTLTLL